MTWPIKWLILSFVLLAGSPALAQSDALPPLPTPTSPDSFSAPPPDSLNPSSDEPAPQTGELVPLPVAPPQDPAAAMKLPDCAPPSCGTPLIMAP